MTLLIVLCIALASVGLRSLYLAFIKEHDYDARDDATWEELIWGQDGKTYDAEADAEFTRLHQGDQGIQG